MTDEQFNQLNSDKLKILNDPRRLEEEREVIEKYGQLFNPSNLDNLTVEDFKGFLLMKNNRHWDGIHRQNNLITQDMPRLISVLKLLLDETQDISVRLNKIFPLAGQSMIKGLGKSIVTPILLMVYPDKYGVWNQKSEDGLIKLGMIKKFRSNQSFSDKYLAINEALQELKTRLGITLFQLDELIGWIFLGNAPIGTTNTDEIIMNDMPRTEEDLENFGLESHLEDFIVENWNKLKELSDYEIYQVDGDYVGKQFITEIGRIDILAKHRESNDFLVIELKKGKSSDAVAGQIMRYLTWVEKNLAQCGQVRGLIIVGDTDKSLEYSIQQVSHKVDLMKYSVKFNLEKYEE
ncbi:MAG: hypothetical protein BWY19_00737 [bacterium ADurb.Bin212]|nr:MAG: hypothetical protein BWY19_00737 [bacterium ADurb.Bin212]